MSANETFTEWLREVREATGTSQQAVGQYLGMPQSMVSKIELNQRPLRLDEAAAIAKFFGANLDGVLAGMPPVTPGTDLVRARRLLTQIHEAIAAELAGGAS